MKTGRYSGFSRVQALFFTQFTKEQHDDSTPETKFSMANNNTMISQESNRLLHNMEYTEPPTIMHMNNKTACGIITGIMKQNKSKAIDMRFHWLSLGPTS